jgi:uncharacterized protein YndB with AHSA1/START domain
MTVAPVVKSVSVKAAPKRVFELFTTEMGRWWPPHLQIGKSPFVAIMVEPRHGGRWFERDAEGAECEWGKVLVWEPPTRVLLGWQLNSRFAYDPEFLTEVELTFVPAAGGGSIVTTSTAISSAAAMTPKRLLGCSAAAGLRASPNSPPTPTPILQWRKHHEPIHRPRHSR